MLRHTYREGNKDVDHLAERCHSLHVGSQSIPMSDHDMGYFLHYDCFGISKIRWIVINY
ncbi:hypothetical protein LINPERPRIM_LOCUS833 [Linum perenne]